MDSAYEPHHAKISLMALVIPKEGSADGAPFSLLMVLHRLLEDRILESSMVIFFKKSMLY